MLEYEGIYFEVVIQTENGLYRRTVRTVQYNHTYSTWNNNILRNSPRNARPTHRQFKAASSPYYPHAKKHLTQVSSSLRICCCCSFLACFFLGGSFFFLLLDRAIRVHLATMEYNNQRVNFVCVFQPLAAKGPWWSETGGQNAKETH